MLSKKSKYALKALVALAKHNRNGLPLRIVEISEKENIPKKFLEAILLDLKKHRILGSKMGINGGYYLIRKPEDLTITEIIRLTDGPIALIPCASLYFYEKCDDCEDEVICSLRKVMTDLRKVSLDVLTNNTIADLVKIESHLIKTKRKK
jgi:Rrf2 family protein